MNSLFFSSANLISPHSRQGSNKGETAHSSRLKASALVGFALCITGLFTTGSAHSQKDGLQPPVFFDFESPAFKPGNIHAQSGWSVDQGKAEITAGAGRDGSAGLVLAPADPFS